MAALSWPALALAAIALAALLSSSPGAPLGVRAPLVSPRERVMLIGDSLAVGLARPLASELRARGVFLSANARGGTHAGQWLGRGWLDQALGRGPDVLLVSLGTNDGISLGEHFPKRARAIVDESHARGVRVVWLRPPPMPYEARMGPVHAGIDQARADAVIDPPAELERSSDRIHATAEGYAEWSAQIVRELVR